MEFKRCERCGCFFISEDNVCYNCIAKDKADTAKLQNYIEEHGTIGSIEDISAGTGITIKNLNRFGEIVQTDETNGGTEYKPFINNEKG